MKLFENFPKEEHPLFFTFILYLIMSQKMHSQPNFNFQIQNNLWILLLDNSDNHDEISNVKTFSANYNNYS